MRNVYLLGYGELYQDLVNNISDATVSKDTDATQPGKGLVCRFCSPLVHS